MPAGFVSDGNQLRLEQFDRTQGLPATHPSAANTPTTPNASAADVNGDGVLDPDEVAALKDAAAQGDEEASTLLRDLGIGGALVGAPVAAAIGLRQAMKNRKPTTLTPVASAPAKTPGTSLVVREPNVTYLNEVETPRHTQLENPVRRLSAPEGSPGNALREAATAFRRIGR